MNDPVEIIKAMVQPTSKLIDAVSGAIGKIYEPTHVRKMADAKAYEIKTIGQALQNNTNIPIEYTEGNVSANTKDFDDLVKRAQSRLGYQEICKQQNIESVTQKAYLLLSDEKECSEEPVDKDWMIRFFNSVEDISDEDMQNLWAKILAGEVKQPKSFSLRTLETLRNLTQKEAKTFQKVAEFVFLNAQDKCITSNEELLLKYGIDFKDIQLLDECGLVSKQTFLQYRSKFGEKTIIFWNKKLIITAQSLSDKEVESSISISLLTRAGAELYNILDIDGNKDYMLDIAERVFRKCSAKAIITVNEIISINGNEFEYNEQSIREYK